MSQSYTYSKATHFAGQVLDFDTLKGNINADATINATRLCIFCRYVGDAVTIDMDGALTNPAQTDALDAVVAAYVYVAPGDTTQFVAEDAEAFTSETVFENIVAMTTGSLPQRDYVISWSYELKNVGDAQVRIVYDVAGTALEIGSNVTQNVGAYRQYSGFYNVTAASGIKQIDLDINAQTNTTYIRRARIRIREYD